jgi:hypothetical protein
MDRSVPTRIAAIFFLSALAGACATAQTQTQAQAPGPLTVDALARARAACGAPDARLSDDGQHLSILLDGDSPDRRRQSQCLFAWVRGHGFWVDQIVIEHANDPDS